MVLSIAHMSMVIFPILFHIFHMSGVKKIRKNQKKNLRAAPSIPKYSHMTGVNPYMSGVNKNAAKL